MPVGEGGLGLSVVEAATHGTPSLAFSPARRLAESILDGQTGVLVDGDEDAYIAALADLLADRERCAVLGRHARAYASEFSWDATAATVARVLDAALGREPLAHVLTLPASDPSAAPAALAS